MKQHLIINNQLNYELLAQYAFNAYSQDANWLTYDGKAIPEWPFLTPEVKKHWIAAIKHICDEQLGIKIVPNE